MPKHSAPLNVTSKPLAVNGLLSYRCKHPSGWIMIGAHDDDDAMTQAKRSSADAKRENLQKWDGTDYVSCSIPEIVLGNEIKVAAVLRANAETPPVRQDQEPIECSRGSFTIEASRPRG